MWLRVTLSIRKKQDVSKLKMFGKDLTTVKLRCKFNGATH